LSCGDLLESRSILKEEVCSCGNIAISGGRHHLDPRAKNGATSFQDESEHGLVPPETTFAKLQRRADALAGVTVQELADLMGRQVPINFTKGKGFVGNLVNSYFGYPANSNPKPDLAEFRVEVKSFAMAENVVATADAAASNIKDNVKLYDFTASKFVNERDWPSSTAFVKLRCLLLVPYVRPRIGWGHTATREEISHFYFRSPIIWLPSEDQANQLETDWLAIHDWYMTGDAEGKKSPGVFAIANTSGPGSTTQAYSWGGRSFVAPKRGFWLTKDIISRLVIENCLLSELS
jgi:DNA mismatch repair protein MutH